MMWKLASLLVMPLLLAGCAPRMATSAPPERVSTRPLVYCTVDRPLGWAAADSDATILAIKHHNAAWRRLCAMKGR